MASPYVRAWPLPVQWPNAATGSSESLVAARLVKAAIVIALLALTVLDRFGLRVSQDGSIPVGMLAMYGLVTAMMLGGAAELNARTGLAYLALAGVAALSLMVNISSAPAVFVSKMSFVFLIALYAPFVVALRKDALPPRLWRWTVDLYVGFALLVALAGIAQYFAQFVFRAPWLFDYTSLIPTPLQATRGFNTVYAVQDTAGGWVKSNGFFMREPSIFSVAMAFGLLCELSLARRKWLIAIFALALLVSYSGSGLACLALAMLFPLGRRTLVRILGVTALGTALFLVLAGPLNLSYTLQRADEFESTRSSAYCRFIYPAVATVRELNSDLLASAIGHGPGSMERRGADCRPGGQTTYAKALFEYGVAGAAAFGALVLGALNRSAAPIRIRVAAGVAWLLLGGNLLDSLYLLFIYVVSAMWPQGTARAALEDAPRNRRHSQT